MLDGGRAAGFLVCLERGNGFFSPRLSAEKRRAIVRVAVFLASEQESSDVSLPCASRHRRRRAVVHSLHLSTLKEETVVRVRIARLKRGERLFPSPHLTASKKEGGCALSAPLAQKRRAVVPLPYLSASEEETVVSSPHPLPVGERRR
jgi:hypothetical protein